MLLDVYERRGFNAFLGALGTGMAVAFESGEEFEVAIGAIALERSNLPVGIAFIHALRGDKERAFVWLDRSYELRSTLLGGGFMVLPAFETLHDDPRWAELRQKMGLPN